MKSVCLRHYNIKPIVQKAARTDGHDDDANEKKSILRVGVTCFTARAPPNNENNLFKNKELPGTRFWDPETTLSQLLISVNRDNAVS